ncbi:glycosyl hydrolase, partial [Bacillus thuringiensis]
MYLGGINIFKEDMKKILASLLKNPLVIIVYWIFCYELALLCMYGRMNNNIYIWLLS